MDTIIRLAMIAIVSYFAIQFFAFIFAGMGPFFMVVIPAAILWIFFTGRRANTNRNQDSHD